MKRRVIKKNGRNKAFIGAIVGAVAGIAGSLISAKKKKKADELNFKQAQAEQTRIEGVQQANAMTSSYADQGYTDQYQNKVVLKNGGKMKIKKGKKGDRIEYNKKFAVGGKKKDYREAYKAGGRKKNEMGSMIGEGGVGGEVAGAIGGVGGLVTSLFSKPKAQKMIKKADGFTFAAPKTELAANSYQLDANGNPITAPINTAIPVNPNTVVPPTVYGDRFAQAKMGKKKRVTKIGGY